MLHQLLRNPFSPCWTPLPELLKCPSFSYITNLTHEEPFSVELLLNQPTKGKQPARSLPPCILLNTQTKINSPKSTAHPAVPWPKCTVWEQILSSNTREPLLEFPGGANTFPRLLPLITLSPEPRWRCWRRNRRAGAELEACPWTHSPQGLCAALSLCCPKAEMCKILGKNMLT